MHYPYPLLPNSPRPHPLQWSRDCEDGLKALLCLWSDFELHQGGRCWNICIQCILCTVCFVVLLVFWQLFLPFFQSSDKIPIDADGKCKGVVPPKLEILFRKLVYILFSPLLTVFNVSENELISLFPMWCFIKEETKNKIVLFFHLKYRSSSTVIGSPRLSINLGSKHLLCTCHRIAWTTTPNILKFRGGGIYR